MTTQHPIQFVSLGPGDPELITLKGLHALQQADCIFCPCTRTADGQTRSRAGQIMQELHIPAERLLYFTLPMSRQRDAALSAYRQVFEDTARLCREGKRVCVAVEGDASLYASIHYVMDRLTESGLPACHIPGIPALIASAAACRLHLVGGQERLLVVPGTATSDQVSQWVESGNTIVVMKLSACKAEMQQCLRRHPDYHYYYVENVGMAEEVVLTDTNEIAGRSFPYFSLLIVRPNRQETYL